MTPLIRSCGLEADYGTLTSGEEHFYDWKTLYPQDDGAMEGMNAQQRLVAGMLMPATTAAHAAHQHGVHGHRQWPTHQGGVRRSSTGRRRASWRGCAQGYTAGTQRRGVAHAGFGQVADHGFGPHAARGDLNDYKIVLVNDRQDLEQQLGGTATLIGAKVHVIDTRAALRATSWAPTALT